ncbi:MAG: DNA topoisomerase I [Candidatus Aenigmarchaeota archaeon]|nr:DNA topoisomerase I [Candidatus Aenigmarchaeota archaeon]
MSYTLIISEKPDAARRISESIADSKPKAVEKNGAAYYEFTVKGKKHVCVPAVGHLFVLNPKKNTKSKGWNYPVFDLDWTPTYSRKGTEWTEKYFKNIAGLVEGAKDFIDAADVDNEGEVLLYNILRFICNAKDAKRMKFSTLTKDELIESYNTMDKHIMFPMVEAGLTRHELDALWGFNLTRALTLALKSNGKKVFAILSTGRVQGPALHMLLEKELEIRKFKPTPFWQLELHIKLDGKDVVANYEEDRIWKEEEAEKILKKSKGKDAVVKDIKKKQYKQNPPVPFNTTDLQSEAYAQFKFSPTQTLSIAESLYQAGFISYPRSSSQKLPPSIGYQKILKAIGKLAPYQKFAEELLKKELKPAEGARDDPAHPAVYATHEAPELKKLNPHQKKIYDLIVRRTLSTFGDVATRESNTVSLDVGGNKFIIVGKRTIEPGWTKVYAPYMSAEELILPELKIGQTVKVSKLDLLSKETQPPGRFSQGSIVKELEKRNLGTKATRAEILQTLYDRGYITGKSIQVTKLGEAVVKALKENSPNIVSEELTKHFENEMEQVFNGKKKRDKVVEQAKHVLADILEEFKKNEKKIGEKLAEALMVSREEDRTLGTCLDCKTGQTKVFFSRFTKKRFAGCSNYFRCAKCKFTRNACKCKCGICGGLKGKCKDTWKDKKWLPSCQTGFPLPAIGKITSMKKQCEVCKWAMIQVWRKGSRPFRMCINHKCSSKADWGKNKKKVKAVKKEATKK